MENLQFEGEDIDELEIPENWDDDPSEISKSEPKPPPNNINKIHNRKKKKNKKFIKDNKNTSNMSSKEMLEKTLKERLQQENSDIELIKEFIVS